MQADYRSVNSGIEKKGNGKSCSYNLKKTFFYALRQTLPILFSYLVVGFAFGIMLAEAGYGWVHALFASCFIYSGSLQIAMVPMIVAGTPLLVMAFASFLINSRYMFYGIGFTERFKRQGIFYPYMIFAFPDEVYCVFCGTAYPKEVDPDRCDLWSALLCHGSWIAGGVLGAAGGNLLPFDLSGIDFAATCLFVCILVNQWQEFESHIPMYVGFLSAILCLLLFGTENFMLPALSLSLIFLVILKTKVEPEKHTDKAQAVRSVEEANIRQPNALTSVSAGLDEAMDSGKGGDAL